MKISAKGEYAYRAIYELARLYVQNPDAIVQLEHIATAQNIPKKYLVQILLQLKRAGLVGTIRGVKGGYFLRKAPSQISLGEVLETIEGSVFPASRSDNKTTGAPEQLNRVIHPIFNEVRLATQEILNKVSFEEICRRTQQTKEQMYYI